MSRLRRDTAGNTLAMMAIALIPLCGIIGSGLDTARLYVVKARLQQACDAGVLAGRKSIINSGAPLDVSPTGQAQQFFKNNFTNGWMRTGTANFTPVKTSDNQVTGTANVPVPMTIMKMFGMPNVTLSVVCEARYDVPDTDIMFVLDTTGSMASKPDGSGGGSKYAYTREDGTTTAYATAEASSGSKISAVRNAVLDFYDTVKSSSDPSTHVRYGFVPYSVSVNVGAAINSRDPSFLVDSWSYNTREAMPEKADTTYGTATTVNTKNTLSTSCATGVVRTPATGYTVTGSGTTSTATAVLKTTTWSSPDGGTCTVVTQPMKVTWNYLKKSLDTSQIKTFATVSDPTRFNSTIKWQGCIEERGPVTSGLTSFNQNSLPADLDPDLMPTTDDTRWKPALPEVSYWRGNVATWQSGGGGSSNPAASSNWWPVTSASTNAGYWMAAGYNSDSVACPKAAKRLSEMTRSEIATYVSAGGDFRPGGYTYHDSGMIWGTRLIAPNGPFSGDTAAWPNRNDPNRYIVFMTDGDMNNLWTAYHLYGVEYYDKRISGQDNDETYHNARFLAECTAAKNRGITVFVIAFGQTLTTQLKSCASPGQAVQANDTPALDAAMQKIAKQIAQLRLSQ